MLRSSLESTNAIVANGINYRIILLNGQEREGKGREGRGGKGRETRHIQNWSTPYLRLISHSDCRRLNMQQKINLRS
jgi:hypothetical protein